MVNKHELSGRYLKLVNKSQWHGWIYKVQDSNGVLRLKDNTPDCGFSGLSNEWELMPKNWTPEHSSNSNNLLSNLIIW